MVKKKLVNFLTSILLFSFFLVCLGFVNPVSAHESEGNVTIHMDEKGFTPSKVSLSVGEKITFENIGKQLHWPASNIHPSHKIYPEFDPKKGIAPGDEWTFTFNKVGVWRFHDHLASEYTGTVTVKGLPGTKKLSFFEKILAFFNLLPKEKQQEQTEKISSHSYNSAIEKDDQTIVRDENALFSYVKKFGTGQAVKQLASVDTVEGRDCHQGAHLLGRLSYEIYGEKAFAYCSAECHSGCYHGATEAFFKEHGTANLQDNLKIICGSGLNNFLSHQCIHGVGHGLMAWSDYDITEALKDCDLLTSRQDSCYTGVFMENIIGAVPVGSAQVKSTGLTEHVTKYLNDEPLYPCTIVADKYRSACYFYQTSRMVQLFHSDFVKVSHGCLAAPAQYQEVCFESMGRDIDGYTQGQPEKSIALCMNAPYGSFRRGCLSGAVQDTFWDTSGQDTAIQFCKNLIDAKEKEACYTIIISRATQLLGTKGEKETFCQKVENKYTAACRVAIQ